MLVCSLVVIAFSSLSYFFSLQKAVAQWTGRPELGEIDWLAMVLMYSVWLAGIFALRRLYDLRTVMKERERIEAELSTTRTTGSIARFASGIAHDLGNLMSVVKGSIAIAAMQREDPEAFDESLEPAEQAIGNAARLAAMLSRIGGGKPEPVAPMDLNEVVSDMMGVLKHLADDHRVILHTELDPGACMITASKGHVEQVILNLVTNACEAMEGDCRVSVQTHCVNVSDDRIGRLDLAPGEYVQIVVRDTGPGMPAWVKEHMYDPYFTTKQTGTGMGLATVFALVSDNNGAIDVNSEPGQGTSIAVYWPSAA